MMVKEADLTGREPAESPATSSEPSRVTVSSSSSTSSFTGLNRNVAVPLVLPAGIAMSKDSTSGKAPWSSSTLKGAKSSRPAAWVAPELGSNWTRSVVSTSRGSAGRRGAFEASPGQRIWGNDAVTVMSR